MSEVSVNKGACLNVLSDLDIKKRLPLTEIEHDPIPYPKREKNHVRKFAGRLKMIYTPSLDQLSPLTLFKSHLLPRISINSTMMPNIIEDGQKDVYRFIIHIADSTTVSIRYEAHNSFVPMLLKGVVLYRTHDMSIDVPPII